MQLLFTRDQTNKQIYILLLCILLAIHQSLRIWYKLFHITYYQRSMFSFIVSMEITTLKETSIHSNFSHLTFTVNPIEEKVLKMLGMVLK